MARRSLYNFIDESGERAEMSKAGSVRGSGRTAGETESDADHELREGLIPNYIDKQRSPLNSVIIETKRGPELTAICEERRGLRETKRKMKSNACVAQSILISFGKKIQPAFDALPIKTQDALYLQLMEKIAKEANTDVSGLVAHRDETAPHAHGQLVGYNREGTPLTKVMNRQFRRDMQDWMVEIFQPHLPEIERGVRKSVRLAQGDDASKTIHRSVQELHGSLGPEIEAAKAELAKLHDEKATIQRRIDKLLAKEELTAKQKRNLQAYERRLDAREEAISERETETTRLHEIAEKTARDAQSARETAVAAGMAEGREQALSVSQSARETAEMLLTGQLPPSSLSEGAMNLREAVTKIAEAKRTEVARMRMSPSAKRETSIWWDAMNKYCDRLREGVWVKARAEMEAAHEAGKAFLDDLPDNEPLLSRAQNLASGIAAYWNGIEAVFKKLFDHRQSDSKECAYGVLDALLPQPINEYGYMQPLLREAKAELGTLDLADKLQSSSEPSQP